MSSEKWIKDSFVTGMICGIVAFLFIFYLLSYGRALLLNYYPYAIILKPLAVPLITMGLNIILFRMVMINFDKENTGKGILFATVLITLAYFFVFYKSRH